VEHTAVARKTLGPGPRLVPAVKIVLETSRSRARAIGRWSLALSLRLPAYRTNLLRHGFEDSELEGELSDRVIDALVAWGSTDAIEARVREHLDAGADHVCVEVLTGDDTTVPIDAWRQLAPALTAIG
jgi:probable F420-dependent oxidoreductase